MPRNAAAANLVGVNTLERSGATTAHLFTTGTSLGLGAGCLLSGTSTSPSNTALGHQALASLPTASAGFNTAVGYTALQTAAAAGTRCTAVGYQALKVATNPDNTAVGYNAGKAITTGLGNTLIGSGAGALTTTAAGNTVVGWDAAAQAGVGADGVTCMGYRAGYAVTTGSANTFLGYSADGTTSGSQNATAVGHSAKAGQDAVAIGKSATSAGSQATAVGQTTVASANYATALGPKTSATGIGSVAIGCDNANTGASTAVLNEFKFGTASHRYNFPGQLNQPLNAGAQKITNLATPTVGTDAATMAYVDSTAGSAGVNPDGSYAAVGTDALRTRVTADANPRFTLNADGSMEWGDGSAVADTFLARNAAGALSMPGRLGVGANVTTAVLVRVGDSTTANFSVASGIRYGIYTTPSGSGAADLRGIYSQPAFLGSGGVMAAMCPFLGQCAVSNTTGSIGSATVYGAQGPSLAAGATITTAHGLDIEPQKVTGVTTGYGVRQRGTTDINSFAGLTTIGSTGSATVVASPTGKLVVANGTVPADAMLVVGDNTAAYFSVQDGLPKYGVVSKPASSLTAPVIGFYSEPNNRTVDGSNTAIAYQFAGKLKHTSSTKLADGHGLHIFSPDAAGSAGISIAVGVWIESQDTGPDVTVGRGIVQSGVNDDNYFAGRMALVGGLNVTGTTGFFGAAAVAQPAGTGFTGGFTASTGTAMNNASTSTGGIGSKAYTFGDVVAALKNLGLLASS